MRSFRYIYEEPKTIMNMKKMMISALAILALAIIPASADDVPISVDKLPIEAHKFLKTHFAQNRVVTALHDRDVTDDDYTVILDNGAKIEFTSTGKWESVKSRNGAVPASVVPTKISDYVSQHYNSLGIEKIERKRYGYEAELTNDLDLKFDLNGHFLGLDD